MTLNQKIGRINSFEKKNSVEEEGVNAARGDRKSTTLPAHGAIKSVVRINAASINHGTSGSER